MSVKMPLSFMPAILEADMATMCGADRRLELVVVSFVNSVSHGILSATTRMFSDSYSALNASTILSIVSPSVPVNPFQKRMTVNPSAEGSFGSFPAQPIRHDNDSAAARINPIILLVFFIFFLLIIETVILFRPFTIAL